MKTILCIKCITVKLFDSNLKEYVEHFTNDLKAIPEDFEKSECAAQWPDEITD